MSSAKKNWTLPLVVPVKKGAAKLWRIEKKLRSLFNKRAEEVLPINLNIGSVEEVAQRADTARTLLRRAMRRKRRSESEK